jgi:predicted membrane channel-forming protein YqfA (hemolysin III family)
MRLFLPSARATNVLLIVGFCALGYAFYMRYLVIEQSTVSLACEGGAKSWLCTSRTIVTALFTYTVFGWTALLVAALNLLRPSLVLFAVAIAATCFGLVLYNCGLAALAAGLLVLSLARRAPAAA